MTATQPVVSNIAASVLELPCKGRAMSMAVVLPAQDFSLEDLEATLTAEVLTGCLSRLRARGTVIEMPRFTIDAVPFSRVVPLASLGVTSLFDAATCAPSGARRNKVRAFKFVERNHRSFGAQLFSLANCDRREVATCSCHQVLTSWRAKGGHPVPFYTDKGFGKVSEWGLPNSTLDIGHRRLLANEAGRPVKAQ